jgi:predicted RNase H-like HicB family nuclease
MEWIRMSRNFTLEYWIDEGWYVGRLEEVPGVFSQGKSLQELEENIRDAYYLMLEDESLSFPYEVQVKEICV